MKVNSVCKAPQPTDKYFKYCARQIGHKADMPNSSHALEKQIFSKLRMYIGDAL